MDTVYILCPQIAIMLVSEMSSHSSSNILKDKSHSVYKVYKNGRKLRLINMIELEFKVKKS